jgi:hypothetical protein
MMVRAIGAWSVGMATVAAATSRSATGPRTCTPRVAAACWNPATPSAASRTGSVNSASTSRPTLVPNRLETQPLTPGKARSTWPRSWFLRAVRAVTRRSRWATHPASSPSAEARTR